MVWKPFLVGAIFEKSSLPLSSLEIRWSVLCNVFGATKRSRPDYMKLYESAPTDSRWNDRFQESHSSQMMQTTLRSIQEHVPELVSFNESVVDQNAWEQAAVLAVRSEAVEVNLFALIRSFVGYTSLPSLVGSDFLEVYPTTLDDVWELDGGFRWLARGVPRLLGIPALARAHIARKRLLNAMFSFHQALDAVDHGTDPTQPWRDLDDVGDIMKERSSAWRTRGTPYAIKDPCDLSLLWAMSTKPGHLVFWMLTQIWATPGLLHEVREEISQFAKGTQPAQIFAMLEPARLKMDIDGLTESCPPLKASFYECIRLYSTPTSIRSVQVDQVFREAREDSDSHVQPQSYTLETGDLVTAPMRLYHYDQLYFRNPYAFRPRRFLKPNENGHEQQTLLDQTAKLWGVGECACPGGMYAQKEVLAITAGILAMWDFEPVDSRGWIVPKQSERAVVSVPSADITVRLRPRKLDP